MDLIYIKVEGGAPALSVPYKTRSSLIANEALQSSRGIDDLGSDGAQRQARDGFGDRRNTAMSWLSSNWIWVALGVGAFAFFVLGRGGCGMGHGSHDHRQRGERDEPDRLRETTGLFGTPAARVDSADSSLQPAGHAHEAALATEHASHGRAGGEAAPRRHRHGC